MKTACSLVAAIIGVMAPSASFAQTRLSFDPSQLSGWWAESYSTDPACGFRNVRTKHEFSEDGKRLVMRFDRKRTTDIGELEKAEASVLSSTERSVVIRYDGENRKRKDGRPVEWELAIVAPGIYRWRETSWEIGEVNAVVGVKCSD